MRSLEKRVFRNILESDCLVVNDVYTLLGYSGKSFYSVQIIILLKTFLFGDLADVVLGEQR